MDAPEHLDVQVIPEKLHFTKKNQKLGFGVNLSTKYLFESDIFNLSSHSSLEYMIYSLGVKFDDEQN